MPKSTAALTTDQARAIYKAADRWAAAEFALGMAMGREPITTRSTEAREAQTALMDAIRDAAGRYDWYKQYDAQSASQAVRQD